MVKDILHGQMAQAIVETLLMANLRVVEYITILRRERIQVNGRITKCMGRVISLGMTEDNMLVCIKMITRMGKGSSLGQTVGNSKAPLQMANNKELDIT